MFAEVINLKKNDLYMRIKSSNIYNNFFYKSILHNLLVMEIFCNNSTDGIAFETLCSNIPKLLGSRTTIQKLLNEGVEKNLFKKVLSKKDKRIKNYYLSNEFFKILVDWVKVQKNIFNS